MSELDKFKRRTIRSVARLLLKEKKPPEELWAEMKKETGTDCRVLWERMRALCIKKLNHMIAVDDRSASLPSIARLSLTDWLLVDLVLVHEEIDVIGMDKDENKEYPALIELFNLVQRFDIEGRSGELLAEAWAAGTVFYNRQGRQCSPMLLQRRWYQLKKLTRLRFYKFWFSYRGNTRLLEEARKAMPTRLQMAIAKRYPKMITARFPEWEDLMEKGFVIMPEEFEAKMRMPNLPKPCSSNAPDLVLVEPVIETIRVESDSEDQNDDIEGTSDPENSNDATDITTPEPTDELDQMAEEQKGINEEALAANSQETEPIEEDGLSNVQLISATHVPEVEIPDESPDKSPDVVPPNKDDSETPRIQERMDNSPDDDEDDVIEIPSIVPTINVGLEESNENGQTVSAHVPPTNVPCDVESINDSDEGIDDIIKVRAEEFCRKATEEGPAENHNAIDNLIKDKVDTFLKKPKEDVSLSEKKLDVSNINLINKAEMAAIDLMADLNFVDDDIEFVDDGVEFVEDDDTNKTEPTINTTPVDQTEEAAEENKFDLKLLMYPVVYTTKLDQMKIFTNKPFTIVENKEDIETACIESKPISRKLFSMKIKQESVTSMAEDTADSDDLFTNQEVTDDEEIEEDTKVSPNSYMLKKPKTRTYDLIKLCKNPDFNTKLKRLTIGFLSSTRNRQLLNACIPMTIDLSKAFESKLVNSTLYLKSSGTSPFVVKEEVTDKQASSIVPSAMPVQSLINNSKVDIHNLISNQTSSEPIVAERTKVINLPDIDKVRRINQQLLTAQVPPLRVYSGNVPKETPPVSPASGEPRVITDRSYSVNPSVSSTAVTVPSSQPIQPVIESTTTQNIPPVKVKIEGDKTSNTTGTVISTPPETLPPAKEKLLKMINQAKISTQEALAKIDDSIKQDDFPMPIVVNDVKAQIPQEMPRKYGYQPQVKLAWASRYTQQSKHPDDLGLLTSDTLNKMLHLLMSGSQDGKGCKCCVTKTKAYKKKAKGNKEEVKQKEVGSSKKKQGGNNSEPAQNIEGVPETSAQVSSEEKTQKPKERKVKTRLVVLGRVVKYCCWAREKICNRKRITRHKCLPDECKCCCAEELALKIVADEEKKRKELEMRDAIELSDDEDNSLRKACESIETVVQQSRDITNTNFGQVETPAVQTMVIEPIRTSSDVDSPSSSPVKLSATVTPSELQHEMITTPRKVPFIQTIRAAPVASLMPQRPPPPRMKQVVPRPQVGQPSQWVPCSCRKPAVSQDSRWNIVIDASASNCARHPTPIASTIPFVPTTPVIPMTPIAPKTSIAPKTPPPLIVSSSAPKPQEKFLYLHSKSIAKSPSESPIFLGKNKILLTTVKFPRKTDDVAPPEVYQAPKIIPTLPLPAGVQLMLMPSGIVTYTLDPGVELDETQLAAMPTIIAAVQEQLNASDPVITSGAVAEPQISTNADVEPVSVPQPEISVPENINVPTSRETINTPQTVGNNITETTESPSPITLKTNEVFKDTELPPKVTNVVDMEVDAENTNADASTPQETIISVPEKVTAPLTEDTVSNLTLDPEAPKNNTEPVMPQILSVVGGSLISMAEKVTAPLTEDTVSNLTLDPEAPKDNTEPVMPQILSIVGGSQVRETENLVGGREQPNDEEAITNRKSLLSDLMEMSGISAEDTIAPEPIVSAPPMTNLQNTANIAGNEELRNLPELSPVTSFAELKYACEQNGKFFKLDFETGVIVPINVCIKRNPKNKLITVKECIDLTDDAESSELNTTQGTQIQSASSQAKGPEEYIYQGKTLSVPTVKPVKLFKAFRPTPTVLRTKRLLNSRVESLININKKTHTEKRKQTLSNAKVEAKIDLIDSDAEPMEEEYLVDSSDDDSPTEPMLIEALDPSAESDYSSDDEPLAKKFKRLKEAEQKGDVRETNIFDEIPDVLKLPDPNELTLSVRKDFDTVIDTPAEKVLLNPTLPQTNPSPIDIIPFVSVSVKNNSSSKVTSDAPVVTNESDMFAAERASDDEELDKTQPEIRFMSDPSDGESAEDCILGV